MKQQLLWMIPPHQVDLSVIYDFITNFFVCFSDQNSSNSYVAHVFLFLQDVGLWLEEINLGSYRQIFKENGVNGEYLEGMSMFTTEQILRFIRRCHMKWGDFITLCKELRRIKGSTIFCLSIIFLMPLSKPEGQIIV